MARSIFFYTDSRELGGAEKAMLMLLEQLDRARWAPALLLDAGGDTGPLEERAAALEVPSRRVAAMPLGLAGARNGAALARQLRREQPALFHAHLSWPLAAKWALAAAVAARVPSVATVQLIPAMALERSSALQLRLLARGVGRYIAVSEAIAGELAERFRYQAEKIEVVYNAVELDRFGGPAPAGLRAELSDDPAAPLVLTAARLDEQKGHDVLLRAAVALPEVRFALAGDGPLRAQLEAEAARLGVAGRIKFLGRREDVPQLLAACDVFALPSLYEGSSLAVLEAMAARRAVVSSAIGGTAELIADGVDGVLVAPGDDAALATALQRLVGDAALRERLGAGARERAEHFGSAAMGRRVEGIYADLLDE
ncbi:MAG TPA: glycosyltransferase [Solirubrobacterales bacterium]|nr:glycosyltransferase [Solirubrobacterales bacterium]